MLNHSDIMSTVDMIDHQHLDIRTITMGISLLDCADPDPAACARKIHDKICRQAEHLVATGCQIERELGIPIVNKRISVTPIALVASACETEDFVPFARAMDQAAFPTAIITSRPGPKLRSASTRRTAASGCTARMASPMI